MKICLKHKNIVKANHDTYFIHPHLYVLSIHCNWGKIVFFNANLMNILIPMSNHILSFKYMNKRMSMSMICMLQSFFFHFYVIFKNRV